MLCFCSWYTCEDCTIFTKINDPGREIARRPFHHLFMLSFTPKQGAELIRRKHAHARIIFVSGDFNIVHPGHLRLLNFAKSCGDVLVVGLFSDRGSQTIVPFEMRRDGLTSLVAVDEVLELQPATLISLLESLTPFAVVKGKEHEGGFNPEEEVLARTGGHLIFSAGEAKFSSVDLISREFLGSNRHFFRPDINYLARHHISIDRLTRLVQNFSKVRVLTVGDLIVDEYIHCDPIGMSQEDPTIVVTPIKTDTFVGGAGIVAAHAAALGAGSALISVVGEDLVATNSHRELGVFKVNSVFLKDSSRPTTLKQRFRASGKTLLRVNHMRSHDIEAALMTRFLTEVDALIVDADVVIFSDFNYGCLPDILVDKVITRCKSLSIPFLADSQSSSQVGDVSRYRGAALTAATEREVRLAMNDFKSGLQNVANGLLVKANIGSLLVKLGAEGLIALSTGGKYLTDSLGAMNSNPVDPAGAGDAMLATAALALASGGNVWECAYLGSLASAIQVSRVGNIPLTNVLLANALNS